MQPKKWMFGFTFFDQETNELVFSIKMEFLLDKHSFTANRTILERTLHFDDNERRLITTSSIVTLQDLPMPALYPDYPNTPIKKGDTVWRDWRDVKDTLRGKELIRLVREYKPLWELGEDGFYLLMMKNLPKNQTT